MHLHTAPKAIPPVCQSTTLKRVRVSLLDLRHIHAVFLLSTLTITAVVPRAHAQLNPGDILVVDADAGRDRHGMLLRVDHGTGKRTILSDFNDDNKGLKGEAPQGVAVESSGQILVVDPRSGLLFRVNPATGFRT